MKTRAILTAVCAFGFALSASAIAQTKTAVRHEVMDTSKGVTLTAWSIDKAAQIGSFHIDHFEKRGLTLYVVGWFMGGPNEVLAVPPSAPGAPTNKSQLYTFRSIADPGVKVGMPVEFGGASCDSIAMVVGPADGGGVHEQSMINLKDAKKDPKRAKTMFMMMLTPGLLRASDGRTQMCSNASLINGKASRSAIADHLNMMVGVKAAK